MKKNTLFVAVLTAMSLAMSLLVLPVAVSAAPPTPPTCGKDSAGDDIVTSFDYQCTSDTTGSITSMLLYAINVLAVGVGVAVVGGIVWGGLQYAASDGDPAKTKEAIEVIKNAVIGLVLFFAMYASVNFLVPGGLFN